MLITNPNCTKQIKSFVDQAHDVMMEYCDLLDKNISEHKLLKEMLKLTKKDNDFYDSHCTASDILFSQGKTAEAATILKDAYERAILRIADSKGRWPKEMSWGWLENRHIMRVIESYGMFCWEEEKIDEALDIFRRLLRCNPGDNQGMRYNILAIKMGLSLEGWHQPFLAKHNGKVIGLDGFKVATWFKDNAKNYPDEFQWLLDYYAELDKA